MRNLVGSSIPFAMASAEASTPIHRHERSTQTHLRVSTRRMCQPIEARTAFMCLSVGAGE
jgi:hypothetical protein